MLLILDLLLILPYHAEKYKSSIKKKAWKRNSGFSNNS